MCGIVGYIGSQQASPILLEGLRRMEYRGYDSAGVAIWNNGESLVARCRGKLSGLVEMLEREPLPGLLGIGHTRWATHGRPSKRNAHPHKVGPISVVHNGIIENHTELRQRLGDSGARFTSETDTEIFAHLISRELDDGKGDTAAAVRAALRDVRGAYAIVVLNDVDPDQLVAAKNGSPLIIGLGENENFVASDVTALLDRTRRMVFVGDGEVVTLRRDGVQLADQTGEIVTREPRVIAWSPMQAEKAGFRHFMLKEIHEQPRCVADTLAGRVDLDSETTNLDGIEIDPTALQRIVIVACGTSYHAALVGKFLIESLARLPVEVDLASEFRYRDPVIGEHDLVVAISQSGETADTMAAVREARDRRAMTLGISNVLDSSIPRLCDHVFYTHAGPEIGVASTKAFTTQLVALVLLAINLGRRRGVLARKRARELLEELLALPSKMSDVIAHGAQIQVLARRYGKATGFLFLGRGAQYPIALEAALKLKEISYVHAEGYAAGEMKHGPIALIDDTLPVVALTPTNPSYEKVVANISEVRAREGRVLAVATRGDIHIGDSADDVVMIPEVALELQPILTTLPMQLFAYHVAALRGTDIDQPRNLAKSVTVE